jgi:hypothetical protein
MVQRYCLFSLKSIFNENMKSVLKLLGLASSLLFFGISPAQAGLVYGYAGQALATSSGMQAAPPQANISFGSPGPSQATASPAYSSDLVSTTTTSTAGSSPGAIFAYSKSDSTTTSPADLLPVNKRSFQDNGTSSSHTYVNAYDSFLFDAGALNGQRGSITFSIDVTNNSTGSGSGLLWSGSYQWSGIAQFSDVLGSKRWSNQETYSDNYHRLPGGADAYHTGGTDGVALGSLTGYAAGTYTFSLDVIFGQSVDIQLQLQTWSEATAATYGPTYSVSTADYLADLGITWGGISGVYRADGSQVGKYSAISQTSGFDYGSAYVQSEPGSSVPEPSSAALVLLGIPLAAFAFKRKKSNKT